MGGLADFTISQGPVEDLLFIRSLSQFLYLLILWSLPICSATSLTVAPASSFFMPSKHVLCSIHAELIPFSEEALSLLALVLFRVLSEVPELWPPDAKSWLLGKDPDAGKDWRREENGMTEDEMVGWHYWINGHEFGQSSGDSEGQGSLAWSMRSQRVGHDWATEQQQLPVLSFLYCFWSSCCPRDLT